MSPRPLTPLDMRQLQAVHRAGRGSDGFGIFDAALAEARAKDEEALAAVRRGECEALEWDRARVARHRECKPWLLVLIASALQRLEQIERRPGVPHSLLAQELRAVLDNHAGGQCPAEEGR